MKTSKAYIASVGTSGILIGSFVLLLFVGSAIVAFNGIPGGGDAGGLGRVSVEPRDARRASAAAESTTRSRARSERRRTVDRAGRRGEDASERRAGAERLGSGPRERSGGGGDQPGGTAPGAPGTDGGDGGGQNGGGAGGTTQLPDAPQLPVDTGDGSTQVPGVGDVTTTLGNTVEEVTGEVGGTVDGVAPGVGETVTDTGQVVGDTVGGVGDTVDGVVGGLGGSLGGG